MTATGLATPLWLAQPTRFARFGRARARIGLACLVLLLIASLTAVHSASPPIVHRDPARAAKENKDVALYQAIVEGVRGGGNYYAVAAAALRAGDYPLKPFVTFRLPTLALVEAILPYWVAVALLYALVAGVVVAWYARLAPAFARAPPRIIAMMLLAAGMAVFVERGLIVFHELWAGPLVALSLALRRPERWVTAVAVGLIAMLVRETAALYVGVMGLSALIERRRAETIGWGVAVAVFAVVMAFHADAVAHVVQPSDPHSPGWAGMLGFGFYVKTQMLSTALLVVPRLIAALLVGFALFGWAAWADPLAARALGMFAAYAALIGLAGRTDTFYWGMMTAPVILVGLAFVPDASRDLIARARRRRITVTRLAR